jgi:hypothetical protein
MARKPKISPRVRAAVIADLMGGEQPAIVAQKHGVDAGTVRMWKTRYVAADVAFVAPAAPIRQPSLEAEKAYIGGAVLDLLHAKLKASQAIADAASDPEWIRKQPAAELAVLGQWLDATAFAIGDRLAGAGEPADE